MIVACYLDNQLILGGPIHRVAEFLGVAQHAVTARDLYAGSRWVEVPLEEWRKLYSVKR